ncbi:HNH endonuclease [Pseudomonas moorei]|uniref:HNH endonuclease n=1 Tax=Pseudomonas moorei TaxID=395599 RepID=UPI0020101344|nr:HNH endonuclease [Pseudomonas moorei]
MARRSGKLKDDPESLRLRLLELIKNFGHELNHGDLRARVIALVPTFHALRDLGSSLIPKSSAASARDRIILYLVTYPRKVIKGDELMVVSGIGEWARRVRELRVEQGWSIVTGVTAAEMVKAGDLDLDLLGVTSLMVDDYLLLDENQDRDAAFRWNNANTIRKLPLSVKDKLLKFLQKNVGRSVTGEELRYVAGNSTEWARRVRELRTEEGWSITTRTTGRPDLPIGAYVLEDLNQTPPHDRKIPDDVRGKVLIRDSYTCRHCPWNHDMWNASDPRHLELHHVVHHAKGGQNSVDNLITLCTVCHHKVHRKEKFE